MFREAVVKNTFYPNNQDILKDFFKQFSSSKKKDAIGVICPHAGYVYSGKTAVKVLGNVKIPNRVLILSPNHTGLGKNLSVYPEGSWESPFGKVEIDSAASSFLAEQKLFESDITAHLNEHSAEVMIPILKYFNKNIKIIPVTMRYISLDNCKIAAEGIFNFLKRYPDTLILMSSDMNHFEDSEISKKKDKLAIDKIMNLDAEGLYKTVAEYSISMCGVIPVTIGIMSMLKLDKNIKAELVEYTNSGEVSGDFTNVVGYLGMRFYEEKNNEN